MKQDEDRFVILGMSNKNRLLVVVHTEHGDKIKNNKCKKSN